MSAYSIEILRSNLATTRVTPMADPAQVVLDSQSVLLQVDQFALTANNITYGVAGDMIGYWQFFPAETGWGRIPVWGMATVMRSEAQGIEPGQRFYGYFPMSSYLVVQAARVSERGFVDAIAHRAALPPTYNQYSRVNPQNGYPPKFDRHQMVYRPLFTTSFVLDDFIVDNGHFGADNIILSSASSKTSLGLASLLKAHRNLSITGLTSSSNLNFVNRLGLYDTLVTYEEIETLNNRQPSVFVDMAGNRRVLSRIHGHFQDQLKYSCGVGITHWESRDGEVLATLPGPKPVMFFAPSQIQKRHKEWGAENFQKTLATAWDLFLTRVDDWITIEVRHGETGLLTTYAEVLAGAAPNKAFVIELE